MIDKEKEQVVWRPYPDYPFIEANQFGEIRIRDRVVTYKDGERTLNYNGYKNYKFSAGDSKYFACQLFITWFFEINKVLVPDLEPRKIPRIICLHLSLPSCIYRSFVSYYYYGGLI